MFRDHNNLATPCIFSRIGNTAFFEGWGNKENRKSFSDTFISSMYSPGGRNKTHGLWGICLTLYTYMTRSCYFHSRFPFDASVCHTANKILLINPFIDDCITFSVDLQLNSLFNLVRTFHMRSSHFNICVHDTAV